MKKGIIRVTAVFMTVFSVAGLLYGCDGNESDNTVTDPQGITYLAIEGSDGKTYAGVTDANGQLYAAKIDESGNVLKDDEVYIVDDYDGTLPTNDTTVVSVNDVVSDNYNYAGDVVTKEHSTVSSTSSTTAKNDDSSESLTKTNASTKPGGTTSKNTTTKKPSSTTTTAAKETELLAEKYKKLFASGTYYIEFSSDMMDSPVVAAVKNGNIYMKTELEGMNCTMIYQKEKDSVYVVLTDYRVYCKMPSSMLDELDMTDFGDGSEVKDVAVYEATIGDRECTCEAYELKNGGVSTYYFYQGTLVRMDQIDKNGSTSVMNVTKVSSSVEDSLFELPKGYIPFNLSKLDLDSFDDETTSSND